MTKFSLLVVIALHGLLAVILMLRYLDLLSSQSPVRDHAHDCVQRNRNTVAFLKHQIAPVCQRSFLTLFCVFCYGS